jgi:hypothetical protein
MSGRHDGDENWTGETANDNEPCRTVAAEGVVQCLQFLANEAEYLGYDTACRDILRAAFSLQAEINAERTNGVAASKGLTAIERMAPAVLAPTA